MEKMNFGIGTGRNSDGTCSVADVAYLAMIYTGSHNLSVWDRISAALALPEHISAAVEDVSKAFECLELLEDRMCVAMLDSHFGQPDAFRGLMLDICTRFYAACNTFGVDAQELVRFWNDKLDILRGGHLKTGFESVL